MRMVLDLPASESFDILILKMEEKEYLKAIPRSSEAGIIFNHRNN